MSDQPDSVQEIMPGLQMETLANGRILVFTLAHMTRPIVDAWIGACDSAMQAALHAQRPILILQDLSDPHITQTPYSREKGQILVDAYPELVGRVAFILPNTVDNQRIRLFVQRQAHQNRERQIFFDRAEAISWLREMLT